LSVSERNLIDKYVFQPLYDSTKSLNNFKLNRYQIKGTYQSQGGSEFQLNAKCSNRFGTGGCGSMPLQEGVDFTVDYNIGGQF
jgi:cell surface protein SprA